MNARLTHRRKQALTIIDVLVLIVGLIILAAVFLTELAKIKKRDSSLNCTSHLRQVSLAFRIWEGDHNNQYPMTVSVANGGAMELIATGNVAACFQVMSNELSAPKILICPYDRKHVPAANFTTDFNNSHISYFLNPDASEAYPQELMSGDDNLAINDVPVKSGLLLLSTNIAFSWTAERHIQVVNISFADGSVAEESSMGLQNVYELSINGTGLTTNRLAIP